MFSEKGFWVSSDGLTHAKQLVGHERVIKRNLLMTQLYFLLLVSFIFDVRGQRLPIDD